MKYTVFYSFQDSEEERLDDEGYELDAAGTAALLDKMTADGDFLGLIDAEGNTFQVMYDGEAEAFWAEIPVPDRQGSYGAVYLKDELKPVMTGLKPVFKVEDFPIFEFEEWDLDEDDDYEEDEE